MSDAYALAVNTKSEKFNSVILVEGVKVNFLVDTGASVSILTLRTYKQLCERLKIQPKLEKAKISVHTYGSDSKENNLKVLGKIQLTIETPQKISYETFYVIDTNHKNLLSGKATLELDILLFKNPVYNLQECEKVEFKSEHLINNSDFEQNIHTVPESLRPLLKEFENNVLSNKIGKLKEYLVKLNIDKNDPPIAQRERRIPLALRERLNIEIEKLEKAGIIEDVTNEPTPWLNPLVIAPKPDGKSIRLCLDMRCANKAITRTNYSTPTIDDLKCKLRGSAVFSKLDLRSAFHQLELAAVDILPHFKLTLA